MLIADIVSSSLERTLGHIYRVAEFAHFRVGVEIEFIEERPNRKLEVDIAAGYLRFNGKFDKGMPVAFDCDM